MKQEVTNFSKFHVLLKMMPGVEDSARMKDELVAKFTDFRTTSLREMKLNEYSRMVEWMDTFIAADGGDAPVKRGRAGDGPEADVWRKRAIASVFGFYRKIKEPVTLEYVKGIICRAGGAKNINEITPATLREIYSAFVRKQRVKVAVDAVVEDELRKFDYL